jgi:hypothetical protein
MTDFIRRARATNAKPGTWGYAEATCSHCGDAADITISLRAYYECGEYEGTAEANICEKCLRHALRAIETRSDLSDV